MRCGIRYLIGGSLASSASGEPRSTLDVDVVVALQEADVDSFLAALGEEFYVDEETVRQAVRLRSSVNVIHRPTFTKVDLFILGSSSFEEEQMDRRMRLKLPSAPDRFLYVYTPEDILLQKLRWFRLGGEVSDRQWRDVLGILAVQGNRLDQDYLRRGASSLGVVDLLALALRQARSEGGRAT